MRGQNAGAHAPVETGGIHVKFGWIAAAALAAILCIGGTTTAHAGLPGPEGAPAPHCPTDPAMPAATPAAMLPTGGGPAYGTMQYPRGAPLDMKQIALTFDDGPDPKTTRRVLDILDRHCIKATFFMVGIYAQRHPEIVREVAARGHIIGTHSWSHPNNLRHLSPSAARRQIRRGFEALETALATAPEESRARLAPFFRFPGLNDSKALIGWLGQRNIATISCEFGADDWKRIGPAQIHSRALRNAGYAGRGILILHDTKPHTADMLSSLITTMRKQGYSFVQLVPATGARELAAASHDPLIGVVRRTGPRPPVTLKAAAKPLLEPASALR